jgi:hypothetical protein
VLTAIVSLGLRQDTPSSVSDVNRAEEPQLTASSYKFNSFADCVRHTYKTEGFHGFWRGQ